MKNLLPVLIMAVMLLCSCTMVSAPSESTTRSVAQKMVYFKDYKTDLCFATTVSVLSNDFSNVVSITCVPCNQKVDSLINLSENK